MALSVAIFVGESQKWIHEVVQKAKSLTIGPGIENKDIGPLISPESKKRIFEIIEKSIKQGGKVLLDERIIKQD